MIATLRAILDALKDYEGFVMTIGCGLVSTGLRIADKLDQTNYTTIIMGTVGVFIAATAYALKAKYAAASVAQA